MKLVETVQSNPPSQRAKLWLEDLTSLLLEKSREKEREEKKEEELLDPQLRSF